MVLNQRIDAPPIREVFRIISKKAEWRSKTAYQKWCYLYSIGRGSLDVLGFPVYHEKMIFHWYTWVFFVYLAIDTFGVLYTGYYCMFTGEFSEFLPCTILFAGPLACVRLDEFSFQIMILADWYWMQILYFQSAPMGLQAATKKGCALFHSLVDFGGRCIHPIQNDDNEYTNICATQMDETVRMLITKMFMMTTAMLSFNVGPIYSYFAHGTKTTMTNIHVPFTERYSNSEFILNVLLSAVIGIHGYIGYIGLEVSMALFSDVVTITPKLVEYHLNGLIQRNEKKTISRSELSYRFKNIIKQSSDADEYLSCIGDLLYVRTLITPSLFTYSIGLGIFCQYMVSNKLIIDFVHLLYGDNSIYFSRWDIQLVMEWHSFPTYNSIMCVNSVRILKTMVSLKCSTIPHGIHCQRNTN